MSRQATAGAVAGTRPIGLATGVWTSSRPPPDATLSRRRATAGPYVDRHLDLASPSPRCLSFGPKKLNTLAGGTLPCLDRAGAPWPPRPCKGRPSESCSSCGVQRALKCWWRTSLCSASRSMIQAKHATEDDCDALLPAHAVASTRTADLPLAGPSPPFGKRHHRGRPFPAGRDANGGAGRLSLLAQTGRTSLASHATDPD